MPLRVRTDDRAEIVRIEMGETDPDSHLALSTTCVALLHAGHLVGFVLSLGSGGSIHGAPSPR
jgi:hypothetical protein